MTPAKTPAQRQAERKARELAAGRVLWKRWVHRDDAPALAKYADEMAMKRANAEPDPKTPAWWRDGLAVTLMREGVNKHRAREIATGYWAAYCVNENK